MFGNKETDSKDDGRESEEGKSEEGGGRVIKVTKM